MKEATRHPAEAAAELELQVMNAGGAGSLAGCTQGRGTEGETPRRGRLPGGVLAGGPALVQQASEPCWA